MIDRPMNQNNQWTNQQCVNILSPTPAGKCPKHPQGAPGNAAAFQLSSAGLHGPDGDQGSKVFGKRQRLKRVTDI